MRKKVLLIDDDLHFGQSQSHQFAVYSRFAFRHEKDSSRWSEVVSEYKPDFVLLDVAMDPLNGCQIAKAISADPALKHVKILLITGKLLEEEEEQNNHQLQGWPCISKESLKTPNILENRILSL